jgi:hypothetical protein
MPADVPLPITTELLRAHPIYKRARTILSGWHGEQLQAGPPPEKKWRREHLDILEIIGGEKSPDRAEWAWSLCRQITARQILHEFVRCTYEPEAEQRLEAWKALQRLVPLWDEKYANDTDVA